MPEYLSVMTYLNYSDNSALPQIMQQYGEILERLGYAKQDVSEWLAQLPWEEDGSLSGCASDVEVPFEHIQFDGHPLFAKPIAHGWLNENHPELKASWFSLELAIETQTERQDLDSVSSFSNTYIEEHRYRPGVGHIIWQVMREFFATWGEPVWFTHEGQWDKAWLALVTGKGKVWDFQAALIPERLAHRFEVVPEGYSRADVPEGIGLVERERWTVLPWNEGAL